MYEFPSAFPHTQNRFSGSSYLSFITVIHHCHGTLTPSLSVHAVALCALCPPQVCEELKTDVEKMGVTYVKVLGGARHGCVAHGMVAVTAAVSISTTKMWYLAPYRNVTTHFTIYLYGFQWKFCIVFLLV